MEAYKQQLQSFVSFVQEQRHLPTLKQFLKLYTSIALAKLAGLMDMDVDTLRQQLEVLKVSHKLRVPLGMGLCASSCAHVTIATCRCPLLLLYGLQPPRKQ